MDKKILETKAKVNQMIDDKKSQKDIRTLLLSYGYNKEDMEYLYPRKLYLRTLKNFKKQTEQLYLIVRRIFNEVSEMQVGNTDFQKASEKIKWAFNNNAEKSSLRAIKSDLKYDVLQTQVTGAYTPEERVQKLVPTDFYNTDYYKVYKELGGYLATKMPTLDITTLDLRVKTFFHNLLIELKEKPKLHHGGQCYSFDYAITQQLFRLDNIINKSLDNNWEEYIRKDVRGYQIKRFLYFIGSKSE